MNHGEYNFITRILAHAHTHPLVSTRCLTPRTVPAHVCVCMNVRKGKRGYVRHLLSTSGWHGARRKDASIQTMKLRRKYGVGWKQTIHNPSLPLRSSFEGWAHTRKPTQTHSLNWHMCRPKANELVKGEPIHVRGHQSKVRHQSTMGQPPSQPELPRRNPTVLMVPEYSQNTHTILCQQNWQEKAQSYSRRIYTHPRRICFNKKRKMKFAKGNGNLGIKMAMLRAGEAPNWWHWPEI